jgi:SagB-type dehydrogenase family enzyme
MKAGRWKLLLPVMALLLVPAGCGAGPAVSKTMVETVALPEPAYESDVSLERTLRERRSLREYSEEPLTLAQVGQLLWAGQGITSPEGWRTAPSAGGLYPLTLHIVAGNVEGLAAGVYTYRPDGQTLEKLRDGDYREDLARVSLDQAWVAEGAMCIVVTADYEITKAKYGDRATRYVRLEAGHAGQNICLQAVALGLGVVTVGAFDDDGVRDTLGLPDNLAPLYVIPVGNPATEE